MDPEGVHRQAVDAALWGEYMGSDDNSSRVHWRHTGFMPDSIK